MGEIGVIRVISIIGVIGIHIILIAPITLIISTSSEKKICHSRGVLLNLKDKCLFNFKTMKTTTQPASVQRKHI